MMLSAVRFMVVLLELGFGATVILGMFGVNERGA